MNKPFQPRDTKDTRARIDRADSRIEKAEERTELAEARIKQAKIRADSAEIRSEAAETRTEFAKTRTEQAEIRTEQAESRTEQAKTRAEQAEARAEQAEARAEQAELILKNLIESGACAPLFGPLPANAPTEKSGLDKLTPRQREILQLIARGHNTKQIGSMLKISPKTVEYHRLKLMAALKLHDIPSLVRFALRVGLVPPEG